MANTSYRASIMKGGKASPGSKRVNVTLRNAAFDALKRAADARHEAVAGVAADLISAGLGLDAGADDALWTEARQVIASAMNDQMIGDFGHDLPAEHYWFEIERMRDALASAGFALVRRERKSDGD